MHAEPSLNFFFMDDQTIQISNKIFLKPRTRARRVKYTTENGVISMFSADAICSKLFHGPVKLALRSKPLQTCTIVSKQLLVNNFDPYGSSAEQP